MTTGPWVYAAAFGGDLSRLHPRLQDYFGGARGEDRVGVGVFGRAGSPRRWLAYAARPLLGPRLLLPGMARDVPFRIEHRPLPPVGGRPRLRSVRHVRFPRRVVVVEDEVTLLDNGLVLDSLGARGRVELLIRCAAEADGSSVMTAVAARLRLGRWRIPLRGPLAVTLTGRDSWDDVHGHQRVDVVARTPLVGTLIEYSGWFDLVPPSTAGGGGAGVAGPCL